MMKKEQLITASYLLASVGLFVLAIEMWICGAESFCRQSNGLASRIANAAISISVPDYNGSGWSGPSNPNFQVQLTGGSVSLSVPAGGDDGGDDSGGDGH